ncbi:hypothetical protein DYB37_006385 [Aphanomyces astaci]|uniref:Uncharacterized protein n=1 Tax=Aphanomyces astaci TaxID=112090 RepID=A0A3R6X905_APHAT|nr:hypothetical protein DYB35_003309 [Aphanomyces astaci]RHZ03972.1 hypothetical protein DYB37_006385 [Aphanomyces astaci]
MELPGHFKCVAQHVAALPVELHLAKDVKPLQLTYYDQNVDLFHANPNVVPSTTYMRWAAKQLCQDPRFRILHLDETAAAELALQEWRTNMTRAIYQARLNPHEIQDGPVVVRSERGVVRVQETLAPKQPVDAIATPVVVKKPHKPKKS